MSSYSSRSGTSKRGRNGQRGDVEKILKEETDVLPHGDIVRFEELKHRYLVEPCTTCNLIVSIYDIDLLRISPELDQNVCFCVRCGVCGRTVPSSYFLFRSRKYQYTTRNSNGYDVVNYNYKRVPFACPCLDLYSKNEKYMAFKMTSGNQNDDDHPRLKSPSTRMFKRSLKKAPFQDIKNFLRIWEKYIPDDNIGDCTMDALNGIWEERKHGRHADIEIPDDFRNLTFRQMLDVFKEKGKIDNIQGSLHRYVRNRQRK
jgi:hypothetical protein